jgi:hypothetical protein
MRPVFDKYFLVEHAAKRAKIRKSEISVALTASM